MLRHEAECRGGSVVTENLDNLRQGLNIRILALIHNRLHEIRHTAARPWNVHELTEPPHRVPWSMSFARLNDSQQVVHGMPLNKGKLCLLAHPHVFMSKQLYQFLVWPLFETLSEQLFRLSNRRIL